jgi:hypothetical protein
MAKCVRVESSRRKEREKYVKYYYDDVVHSTSSAPVAFHFRGRGVTALRGTLFLLAMTA